MAARSTTTLKHACRCLHPRSFATQVDLPPPSSPIASTSKAQWQPALPPGQFPLYDHALEYIKLDQERELKKVEELRKSAKTKEDHAAIDRADATARTSDPQARWQLANGRADYTQPIIRHLREQRWRRQGDLAFTMKTAKDDKLIPDLFATIEPTVELNVRFDDPPSDTHGEVPSKLVYPAKTLKPPHIRAFVPHGDEQLYTIALVDPDAPDEQRVSFQEKWHWLKTNVALSPSSRDPVAAPGDEILAWHPPHPERGTGVHRYTLVLIKQNASLALSTEDTARHGPLMLRSFVAKHDLTLAGLYHWISSNRGPKAGPTAAVVSHIYKDILKTSEPHFVKHYEANKFRLYGAVGRSKYDV